jgi:hypothetical protein
MAASWISHGWIPDRVVDWLGVIAGVLLVAYLVNLLVKARKPDPSAQGCFPVMVFIVATMLAVLIVGLVFHVRVLTAFVAGITDVTVIFLAPEIVGMMIRDWRNKDL